MQFIGKLVNIKEGVLFLQSLKTNEIFEFSQNLLSNSDITDFFSVSYQAENIAELQGVYSYKTIPSREITTKAIFDEHPVFFMKTFKLPESLSREEAELSFADFFSDSSCNFVQNLTYHETEEESVYVTGDIGVYYVESYAIKELADKFNLQFYKAINIIENNLDDELKVLQNEIIVKETAITCLKALFFMLFGSIILKYFS